jgi:hypothetical protein
MTENIDTSVKEICPRTRSSIHVILSIQVIKLNDNVDDSEGSNDIRSSPACQASCYFLTEVSRPVAGSRV